MAAGSIGNGTESYGVYLPFELPQGRTLKVDEGGSYIEVNDVTFKAERLHHRYAIYGGEFPSKEIAATYLNTLRVSLLWFSLKRRTGLRYPEVISDIRLYEEEKPISDDNEFLSLLGKRGWTVVHGDYDADKAVVIPQHMCLTRWEAGRANIHMGLGLDQFQNALQEAAEFPQSARLTDHPKLKIGIELYATNHFEVSDEAQFLTLVGALEATLESSRVGEASIVAIEKATETVKLQLNNEDENEKKNLEHLLQRNNGLKERSIGDKFRSQIATRGTGLPGTDNLSQSLSSAYETRSRILHDGKTDSERLRIDLEFMREFVPAYLEQEFKNIAGAL